MQVCLVLENNKKNKQTKHGYKYVFFNVFVVFVSIELRIKNEKEKNNFEYQDFNSKTQPGSGYCFFSALTYTHRIKHTTTNKTKIKFLDPAATGSGILSSLSPSVLYAVYCAKYVMKIKPSEGEITKDACNAQFPKKFPMKRKEENNFFFKRKIKANQAKRI